MGANWYKDNLEATKRFQGLKSASGISFLNDPGILTKASLFFVLDSGRNPKKSFLQEIIMPFELGSFSLGSLAGTVIGGLAGHFLTKSRDKESRDVKDFNEQASVLGVALDKMKKELSPFNDNIDFLPFRRVLTEKEQISFDVAVQEYEKARETAEIDAHDNSGEELYIVGCYYSDPKRINAAIDKLLKFTKRR